MLLFKLKSVTLFLPYIAVAAVVVGRWRHYELSWDDADYLRMSSCFSFILTYFDLETIKQCEYALYKAPLFSHLGVFQLPLTLIPGKVNPVDLISGHLVSLLIILLFCVSQILRFLHSIQAKIVFCSVTIFLMLSEIHKYMTDQLAAMISAILVFHYVKSKRIEVTESALFMQFVLAYLLIGIRTTCLPLCLLPILSFLRYVNSPNRRSGFILALFCISIIYFSSFIFLWRSVLPTAFEMAFGGMSEYFKSWINTSGINLHQIAFEMYALPLALVILLILATKSARQVIIFFKQNFEAFIPSSTLLIAVFVSNPDPRFLLWPTYTVLLLLIFATDVKYQSSHRGSFALRNNFLVFASIPLAALLAPIFISGDSKYGLTSPIEIHNKIPSTGTVCPISDSPELNISKVLLVDSLSGKQKKLESRIVNIPDSAMNGLTLDDTRKTTLTCDFVYFDTLTRSGGPKNEYFDELKAALLKEGFFIRELDGHVAYFFRN